MTGNLCPISARRIPRSRARRPAADVQKLLEDQALNSAADLRRIAPLPEDVQVGGLPARRQTAGISDAAAQISALVDARPGRPGRSEIAKSWENKLKDVKSFNLEKAQHAMDQIYVAKGAVKLNGVDAGPDRRRA